MKPASLLPWKIEQRPGTVEVQTHSGAQVVGWTGFEQANLSKKQHAANAAYIVHAANGYRRSVEFIRSLATSSVGGGLSEVDRTHALNLLRDLGEVE